MDRNDDPRTYMQTMSRADERRGTRSVVIGAAIVAIAAGFGLLAWFFVPGFSEPGTPRNAGIRSDQTVGVSVQSQRTEPLRAATPNSPEGYAVQRNQSLTGTARPDLGPLAPAEVDAIRRFAAAHPNDVRPRADFSIAVGAAVPTSVDLSPLPPDLAHALPHYAGDLYIVIGNQFIAVERQTRRIVAIVPLPAVGENTR